MKLLKKLILCLCVSMIVAFSFISPVSAVEYDEETGRLIWTDEELLEFGAVFEPDGTICFPAGTYDPDLLYSASTMIADSAYYDDFDLYQLPWESFPKDVQDILYMSLDGLRAEDYSNYIVPFVMIKIYKSIYIDIFVGTNIGLGMKKNDGNVLRLFTSSGTGAFANSKCYKATYHIDDYSLLSEWTLLDPEPWGSSSEVYYYDSTLALVDVKYDFYLYGSNGVKIGNYTSISLPLFKNSSGTVTNYVDVLPNGYLGFRNGTPFFKNQGDYSSFFTTFVPPTLDELAAKRQQAAINLQEESNANIKNIFETLKNIPTNIANSIKSFFTDLGSKITSLPSQIASSIKSFFTNLGDRISGFFTSLKNYLLYFQAEEPTKDQLNPFEGILDDIQSFFDEQIKDVGNFKKTLNSSLSNVVSYIQSASDMVTTFLTGVPIISFFLIFFVVFAVVRKVVGH